MRDLADYDRAFGLIDGGARPTVRWPDDAPGPPRRRATPAEALKQLTYLAAALKAPRITEAAARLADHARDAGWTHEEYLAAVLDREVAARNASGAQLRIRAAGFGARKTLEEFDWDAQPAVRQQIAALASGGFLTEARNVVLLGPPGTGKTHLATGLGIAAAHHGHRVLFATATEWVTRLTDAHRAGRLPQELARLRRYGLIIVDEVGYLPFEQDAANLFFQLVSSRYEHASLILTSQPAVQRLGRRLRRPGRRRRDDRPRRPPRRRPHPQGRQLPATQPRHRHPAQHQNPRHGRLETNEPVASFSSVASASFSSVADSMDSGHVEIWARAAVSRPQVHVLR